MIRPVLVHPVSEPFHEANMGEGQDEYVTLPVCAITRRTSRGRPYFVSVSRWKLCDEERQQIANGADILHQVMHTPGAYPPMNLQVVDPGNDPAIIST